MKGDKRTLKKKKRGGEVKIEKRGPSRKDKLESSTPPGAIRRN